MEDIYELHAIVKGQVQGVGFRAMTRYHAQHLGLKGTVRNLRDGTVEICAQGPKKTLEALLTKLKDETFPDHITESIIKYVPANNLYSDFQII